MAEKFEKELFLTAPFVKRKEEEHGTVMGRSFHKGNGPDRI